MNAVFLLSDNKYLPLSLNTIKSFQKNNSWFKGDINILFCEEEIPSGDFEHINFFKIDLKAYNSKYFTLDSLIKLLKIPAEKYKTIFKIEVFKYHDRYEKILFIDSDCLVRDSVEPIFKSNDSRIFRYRTGLTNSGVFYSVNNRSLYEVLLKNISSMSKRIVEEFIFTKYLKSFKQLNRKYNDFHLFPDTVIQHMQLVELDEVLKIQNEYNSMSV